jgi:hypothetical protein
MDVRNTVRVRCESWSDDGAKGRLPCAFVDALSIKVWLV